jgi:hypothetical protein
MLSESKISLAIDDLAGKPGVFEKLVGRWIHSAPEFEGRFTRLHIKGRKEEQTVKGWPDAFVEGPDGAWDCVQATHSDRWRRQIAEDLPKIRARRVSGYVMVAWDHGPKDQDELNRKRSKLVAAGVPETGIDFVFKGRLLDSLQDSRFAHLLWEVLGISPETRPFRFVGPERGLIGIDAGSETLQPRAEEFRSGLVHRPSVLPAVIEQLERDGMAEVRGRGAAGKTVLAEHVARWHLANGTPKISDEPEELVTSGPVYYLKLGSFEEGGHAEAVPADAFRRLAAGNALFIVDDVHLNAQAALDLLNEWEVEPRGSKMLRLGREQHIYSDPSLPWGDQPKERVPVQKLVVDLEDLNGIYRRLARLAGIEEPVEPPDDVLREWLDLFQGDLVVFSAAAAARLHRLARSDWRLTESDALVEVRKRYLSDDLGDEERRDLLGLATLSELGAPASGVRSGLPSSRRTGAVLWFEDEGEFRLAHPGLGRLLLAAAGGTREARDVNEWAGADPTFGLRLGVSRWSLGESEQAAEAMSRAVATAKELAPVLLSLPIATAEMAIVVLDALELISAEDLDKRLVAEEADVLACFLDRPDQLASVMGMLRRNCPLAAERLAGKLSEDPAVDALLFHLSHQEAGAGKRLGSWLPAVPGLGLALGSRFGDPLALKDFLLSSRDLAGVLGSKGMRYVIRNSPNLRETMQAMLSGDPGLAGEISQQVLARNLVTAGRACEMLEALSPALAAELRRYVAAPEFEARLIEEFQRVELTELVSLIRFVHRLDPDLLARVEATVTPAERRLLASRLRNEPATLRGIAYSRRISGLLSELTKEMQVLGLEVPARDKPRSSRRPSPIWWRLEQDPEEALYLDLSSVLAFVLVDHRQDRTRSAARSVAERLRAEGSRDRLLRSATTLSPTDFCKFLNWAHAEAPELEDALLTHLEAEPNLASLADVCVEEGQLEHLIGLLDALGSRRPDLADRLVASCTEPERRPLLAESGFRGSPTGWAALGRRPRIAEVVLENMETRRWRHYWRTYPARGISWFRSVCLMLLEYEREDLCGAVIQRVVGQSAPGDWGDTATLSHLAHVLKAEEATEDAVALAFLERIEYESFLDRNYQRASTWAIAHFLNSVRCRRGSSAVAEAIVTDSLARRIREETTAGWAGRTAEEAGGLLALVGAAELIDLAAVAPPPPGSVTLGAMTSLASASDLSASHVLFWVGLRRLVSASGVPLQLPFRGRGLMIRHLELLERAEPSDLRSSEMNVVIMAWLAGGLEEERLLPA